MFKIKNLQQNGNAPSEELVLEILLFTNSEALKHKAEKKERDYKKRTKWGKILPFIVKKSITSAEKEGKFCKGKRWPY